MFVRLVKLQIAASSVKDFEQLFDQYKNDIRHQPGCSHLELLKDRDKEGVFFTYSVWDEESSLENYRNSELFGKVWGTAKTFFSGKPEAWSVERIISVGSGSEQ